MNVSNLSSALWSKLALSAQSFGFSLLSCAPWLVNKLRLVRLGAFWVKLSQPLFRTVDQVNPEDRKTIVTVPGQVTSTDFSAKHKCPECGLEVPLSVTKCPQDGTELTDTLGEGRKLVGNYEFLEFVGSGGMGVIYKARHPVLKRLVAVKMLHSHLMNEAVVKRFQHEAQAVSGLSHPNVIRVHDFGLSEHGQPYMVMDFLEGKPLSVILKQGPLRLEAVLNIAIQIAEALQHAHEHGVLHRDLKPSNIMVTDYDCAFPEAKLVDFGIAKIMENESTRMTQTGELIGTPQYMSPEQCRGGELDARSDVYSLGCVMFESITGKPPFSGESIVSVIVDQISKPARSLAEVRPDMTFSVEVEELLAKALAKEPADRFQSMNELLEETIRVQKLVAKAESSQRSGWRIHRMNRDQRHLLILGVAAVFSLLGVVSSVLYFVKTVHVEAARRADMSTRPQQKSLQERPAQFLDRVQAERVKERAAMMKYIQPDLLDPEFAERFLGDNLNITKLDCEDSKIDDKALIRISNQKRLVDLNLKGTKVTDNGMIYLPLLIYLSGLNLDNTAVTDNGLKFVAQLPSLNYLTLRDDKKVTDKGLAYLRGRNLYSLILDGTQITDKSLPAIGEMENLQNLTLNRCKVTGLGAQYVGKLTRMEFLGLDSCGAGDAWCTAASKMPAIKQLEFGGNKFTAAGVRSISHLPNLEHLNLHSCQLGNETMGLFNKFPKLNYLEVSWNGFDDAGLAIFAASQPKIEEVRMRGCWAITDAGIPSLYSIKSMKKLDLRETHVTPECLAALKKARPDLTIIEKD